MVVIKLAGIRFYESLENTPISRIAFDMSFVSYNSVRSNNTLYVKFELCGTDIASSYFLKKILRY